MQWSKPKPSTESVAGHQVHVIKDNSWLGHQDASSAMAMLLRIASLEVGCYE
jgi:hypothetical protein